MSERHRVPSSNPRRGWIRPAAIASLAALVLAVIWIVGSGDHRDASAVPGQRAAPALRAAASPLGSTGTVGSERPDTAVEGVVLDETGAPVAAASVILDGHAAVSSGADGQFRIGTGAAGAYYLNAQAAGAAAGPLPVRVVESQKTFVTVRLYPGVALAVEVVSAADGRPLARARGTLIINNTQGDAGRLEAVADERGVVRFPTAALASYTVTAEADGFAPATRFVTWNQRTGRTWQVRVALEPGVVLTGRVVNASGAPLPGSRITSRPAPRDRTVAPYRPRPPDPFRPAVVADADGRFRYAVPRGQALVLVARHADHPDGESAVVAERDREITITLATGRAITGRVIDGQGQPVAGAMVDHGDPDRPPVRTGGDGRFTLRGVDPRRPNAVLRAAAAGVRSSPVLVALPAGFDRPVDLALEHRLEIRGTVVHADGTPVADAIVAYRRKSALADPPASDQPVQRLDPIIAGETRADQDGAFVIDALAAGAYDLLARVPAAATDRVARPLMASVEAKAGDSAVVLGLPATARIVGQVVGPDGQPVRAFTISLGELGGTVRFDDAGGRFELGDLDPGPGRYEVSVIAARASERFVKAKVAAGQTTDVGIVHLERGRLLSGRVLDSATGGPVANAVVSVDGPENLRIAIGHTDELGQFAIATTEDPVVVHAAHGGVGGSRFVTVPAGQDRVDLRLPELGQIEVEVEAPAGVAELAVSARRTGVDDAGLRAWLLDPVAGQALFRGQVSPGSYVVHVGPRRTLALGGKDDTEHRHDVNVTVQPGQTHRLRIALTESAASEVRAVLR